MPPKFVDLRVPSLKKIKEFCVGEQPLTPIVIFWHAACQKHAHVCREMSTLILSY
jgi:hypothetical protein